MSTNKAHPHAELMKLYAADAAETDKPWERWEHKHEDLPEYINDESCWKGCDIHPAWQADLMYRRKRVEPALLQGHTMEQWEFIREQEFDCEFSQTEDFAVAVIDKLVCATLEANYRRTPFITGSSLYAFCRPRRAKGVKQPWFGGECPVDENAECAFYRRDGKKGTAYVTDIDWAHREWLTDNDIIAFIEL